MTAAAHKPPSAASDVALSAALLAIGGERLGGAVLSGTPGDALEAWLGALARLRPDLEAPLRLPAGMGAAQIEGGLDLARTLATGVRVMQAGVGERSRGRPILLIGAERWMVPECAELLAAVGAEPCKDARRVILALDESVDGEPGAAAILVDRLAFEVHLDHVRGQSLDLPVNWPDHVRAARALFENVEVPDALIRAIAATAVALGINSSRADVLAMTAARAHAALRGSQVVTEEDVVVAARLVLVPRARQVPAETDEADEAPALEEAPQPEQGSEALPDNEQDDGSSDDDASVTGGLEDRMIEAVAAQLPAGLLDLLRSDAGSARAGKGQARKSNGRQRKDRSGRPVGRGPGDPRRDGPLHLLATIEKAAPWQIVRRRQLADGVAATVNGGRRVLVRPSDICVMRFKRDAPSLTIFAVDASGSAAMHRLGEAKGAVEMLLAECYARREQVALVTFRDAGAEVLLPPTRALARARRTLGQLVGGGATPLAHGIDAAYELALQARRSGQTSLVVLLTDGRANIDARGVADRKRATEHAIASARRLAADRIAGLLVDVASAPNAKAADLARSMNARYLPLPNAGAREIAGAVALRRQTIR